MKKQTELYCHKYYDKNHKRVSIVGEHLNKKKLVLSVYRCSPEDAFNKVRSRIVKELISSGYHTLAEIKERTGISIELKTIDIKGEFPKKEFLEYIRSNYYTYAPVYQKKMKLVKAEEKQLLMEIAKMHK